MYGILPLEEYVANYDSILENKPFQYGNMKGKVLNKSKFFNDYSDYEVLLRNEIPNKYNSYFYIPFENDNNNNNNNIDIDNNDNFEIEFGRSINDKKNNKLNLSPIKNDLDNGFKDSEVLSKKDSLNPISNSSNYLQTEKDFNDINSNFSLNLGNLNLSNNKSKNSSLPISSNLSNKQQRLNFKFNKSSLADLNIDDIDEFYEQTFKMLNKSSLEDKDGKDLNYMIQTLIENLKDTKSENNSLRNNTNELKLIITDLNKLINTYKSKLKTYYLENKSLKSKINNKFKNTILTNDDNRLNYSSNKINDIDEIDEIDNQIKALQLRKNNIIQNKKMVSNNNLNVTELSDNIVNKLMIQLQNHKNENHPQSSSENSSDNYKDCPFCPKSKENDLFSSLFPNTNDKNLSQDKIIESLAERIKLKLNTEVHNKQLPDIW